MNHSQLHAIDLAIIGAYLIAMIVIGLVVVKKIKNTDDYYLGARSFGPLVLMATVCATIIGGSGLMGRAGVAYSRLQGHYDGGSLSSGDADFFRLCRTYIRRRHEL